MFGRSDSGRRFAKDYCDGKTKARVFCGCSGSVLRFLSLIDSADPTQAELVVYLYIVKSFGRRGCYKLLSINSCSVYLRRVKVVVQDVDM